MKTIERKKTTPVCEYVYYDKEIIKYVDAQIGLAANSLQYGTTVFGGIRGFISKNGKVVIFALEKHYKRLMKSCKIMAFDYFISYSEFEKIIWDLVKKNNVKDDFYIRPFIFCDETAMGPKLHLLNFDLAIYMQILSKKVKQKPKGLKLLTSSFTKYSDNSISTKSKVGGSYTNSLLAYNQAHIANCDDAILFNENGFLAEASVSNVMVINDDQILIPHESDGALEGITMRTCLKILDYHKIKYNRTHISRSCLYGASEVLLTGTAMLIDFATIIDGRTISDNLGKIGKLIRNDYLKILQNEHELSKEFLSEEPCQD